MRKLFLPLMTLALAACSPSAPTDTVDSLVANPERLKALHEQCKLDRAKVGEALCNMVGQAINRRFLGKGTPGAGHSAAANELCRSAKIA